MGEVGGIFLVQLSIEVIGELLLLILLLLSTALVSASELAFFSLKPGELSKMEERKSKNDILVLKLIEKPEKLLGCILITNNFLNIAVIILSTYLSYEFLNFASSPVIGFIIQVVLVTSIILLFGEIIPKNFASRQSIRTAHFMAYPLFFMSKLLQPFIKLLTGSTSYVRKKLESKKPNISIDDLSSALEITSESLEEEKNILEGIVKFGNINVSEIMQPRIDIVAADITISIKRLIALVIDSGYSRIPVYENTLDNIKGILYTKDLLPYIFETRFKWQNLVKQAYFVPETKKIDDLLAEFQKNKNHLAIVIDEYGGTSGLVTMEDILEEIIGEIADESDVDEEQLYKKLASNIFLFEAKILLNDFFKITGIDSTIFDDVKGEYETLAGLILELKGEIPQRMAKIDYKNLTFLIESVDKRRIKQVKVVIK